MELKLPDRYELDAEPLLGQGGMGRVVCARDKVLDMPVAIKVVRPDLAADPRFRKLFDREVRVSARILHPHIVPLHDHGVLEDGTPWLGLALADAGSFRHLRDGTATWHEILRLFLELLEALAHLHSRDVLHRDLKPENVLLHTGEDGQVHVWLADLGLARAGSQLAKNKGRREGTPGYMAPEQAMGLPREYGPWTDIYAFGALFWEVVTGSLPFESHQTSAESELPTLQPREGLKVPVTFPLILKNCLHPEPLSRYDLVADLRHELKAMGPPVLSKAEIFEPEIRVGTVRTSAPPPKGKRKTSELLMSLSDATDTSSVHSPYVPRWNRPLPPEMPEVPVPQEGFGASVRASLQLFALRELPLVAREADRKKLWEQARAVQSSHEPRVVLVVGSAGTGKTHLVESVAQALQVGGWAESVRLSYQNPRGAEDGFVGAARAILRPWKESKASLISRLRRRLARERGLLDAAVKEEANLLTRWVGLEDDEAEPVPFGLGLREVYRHLEARSWRGLSLMVLEDAHWSLEEGDGLWLAEAVLRAQERQPLLVVATLRSEELERNQELADRVSALIGEGAVRIDLAPLDREGTRALIEESLALTPELTDLAVQRCEGNPLFARQLLLEWSSRDWLVANGGRFELKDGVDTSAVLPTDAEGLFEARVEGLAAASGNVRRFRDTVHMAAMAGLDLPTGLLASLAGEELTEFALGAGLWDEANGRVRFQSNLLHQSARAQAEGRRDSEYLHRRLGRAWARYGQVSGEDVHLDVGRHAMDGRDFEVAVDHLLESAAASWKRRHTDELMESSSLALEATYRSPKVADRTALASLWRGRAFQMRGEPERAEEHFGGALAQFEARSDPKGATQALIGSAWASLQMGKLEDADAQYGKALKVAREQKDIRSQVEVVQGRAWLEQQKRNFDGADILFTRAATSWAKLKDERGVGEALLGQAYVARRRGEFDEANELYNESIEAFQAGDDLLGIARGLIGLGIVHRQRCEFDAAQEDFEGAISIAEEFGANEIVMEAGYRSAEVLRRRGELDKSAVLYRRHQHWAIQNKKREATILAELGLALVALQRHDLDEVYDRSNAASRALASMPAHWLWATYRLVVAAMLAHRDDEQQTYTWLWSASELGISDIVDEDIAYLLTNITAIAVKQDWRNVLRVAGKLAHQQLLSLGDPEGAEFVKKRMDSVLLAR